MYHLKKDFEIELEPFLLEVHCQSFSNETKEQDIYSLLKPYFGKENYTTFNKYITKFIKYYMQDDSFKKLSFYKYNRKYHLLIYL